MFSLNKVLSVILIVLIVLFSYFTFIVNSEGQKCLNKGNLLYSVNEIEQSIGEQLYCSCSVISNTGYNSFQFNGDGFIKDAVNMSFLGYN